MHYYQFNIGDYASHTKGLSLMEDLAYRRLLDLYYTTEQPLNTCSTEVAREIGMREYQSEVEYVLGKYFKKTDEGFVQERAKKHIEAFQADKEAKSAAGKASAEARRRKASEQASTSAEQPLDARSTDAQLNKNQEPLTNNQEPVKTHASFDDFWQIYPRKTDKAKAKKKWESLKITEETLALINKNISDRLAAGEWSDPKFIPHPTTYLNNARWDDEVITSPEDSVGDFAEQVAEAYGNILGHVLEPPRGISPDRKLLLKSAIDAEPKRADLAWWEKYFAFVADCPFLVGEGQPDASTGRVFKADFEWLINPNKIVKVIEGKYE